MKGSTQAQPGKASQEAPFQDMSPFQDISPQEPPWDTVGGWRGGMVASAGS